MIVYQETKSRFLDDSFKRDIQDVIVAAHSKAAGKRERITLKPDSYDDGFEPLVFEGSKLDELVILAELVKVLTAPRGG